MKNTEKFADFLTMMEQELKSAKSSAPALEEAVVPLDVIVGVTKQSKTPTELLAEQLSGRTIRESEAERWNDPIKTDQYVTTRQMNDHYNTFLTRIQQQLASIGGGGEVNFRNLDDVNRSTLSESNDNWVLEYDATTKKVKFTDEIGPIQIVSFDPTHDTSTHPHSVGDMCWNEDDATINIFHPSGVTQQVGQELYAFVRNKSGATITDGTAVRFEGAEQNGISRLLIEPFLANGSLPSLYGLGIATQNILDGEDGKITVWGKVRGIDTSPWDIGDILYVSPTDEGMLTNIKPTAPNNVIPMAVVLRKDSSDGEIFVRPTIEQQKYYGRFARTTDQTAAAINTGYPVEFNDTVITNGVSIGSIPSRIEVVNSGFYQFDSSIQVTATSNKGVVYVWFRKNGVDIPLSSRRTTVTNGDTFTIHSSLQLSLLADDYIEIIWAATAAGIFLDADDSVSFGPTTSAALLSVGQMQL